MQERFSTSPVKAGRFRFEMETTDKEANENTEETTVVEAKEKTEESLKEYLGNFAQETSIHGVKCTVDKERSWFARLLWTLLGLFAICILLKTLIHLFMSYSGYPVNTIVKVTPTDQLPFPAVTICNLNGLEFRKLEGLDRELNNISRVIKALSLTTSLLRDHANSTIPMIRNKFGEEALQLPYQNVSRRAFADLNSTFLSCFWDNQEEDCRAMFTPLDFEFRRCFQFNAQWPASQRRVSEHSGLTSGLHVLLNVKQDDYVFDETPAAGVKVLLHEPGEIPDIDNQGFLASPGFSAIARIVAKRYNFLPAPFKAFGDKYCIAELSEDSMVRRVTNYTYSTALCHKICFDLRAQDVCQCRVSDISFTRNRSLPLCTVDQVFTCYKNRSSPFVDKVKQSGCDCPRLCDRKEYLELMSFAFFPSDIALETIRNMSFMSMADSRKNLVDLSIYFDDLVYNEIKHVPEYTIESILGTTGGQMGLFAGASILSIAELVELLCHVVHRAVRWLFGRRLHHIRPGSGKL